MESTSNRLAMQAELARLQQQLDAMPVTPPRSKNEPVELDDGFQIMVQSFVDDTKSNPVLIEDSPRPPMRMSLHLGKCLFRCAQYVLLFEVFDQITFRCWLR